MEWFPFQVVDLSRKECSAASASAFGSWVRMLGNCYRLENSGCFEESSEYSSRQWMSIAGVVREEVDEVVAAGLAFWEGKNLVVSGYDLAQQAKARKRSEKAKLANDARWGSRPRTPVGNPPRIATSSPVGNPPRNPEERRGEERRGEEREPPTPSGHELVARFGRIRSEVFPNTLPWNTARDSKGDAASFAAMLGPTEITFIDRTMRLALEHIRDGGKGWNKQEMLNPSFAFGAWKANFHALLEEALRKQPPPPGALEARPPAKPVVKPWQPKTDYAAEAAKDTQALSDLKRQLEEHVTPDEAIG